MKNILSRIEKIADSEGITITALERKIGASKGVLSRAVANGTDIQSKWVQLIVENYPLYSANWLLTGRGKMRQSIGLMSDDEIAQQDADVKAGKVIESVGVPASMSNHPAYQNLLEKVQELAAENSNLNIELKDAYKEISELQKTLLNRV